MNLIVVFLVILLFSGELKAGEKLAESAEACERVLIANHGKGLNWLTSQYKYLLKMKKDAIKLCKMNYVTLHPEQIEQLESTKYDLECWVRLQYNPSSLVSLEFSAPRYQHYKSLKAETVVCSCNLYNNIDPINELLVQNETFTFVKTNGLEHYFHLDVNQEWYGHTKSCYKFSDQEVEDFINCNSIVF